MEGGDLLLRATCMSGVTGVEVLFVILLPSGTSSPPVAIGGTSVGATSFMKRSISSPTPKKPRLVKSLGGAGLTLRDSLAYRFFPNYLFQGRLLLN